MSDAETTIHSGDSPHNACRAMTTALFDQPEMKEVVLAAVETVIRTEYGDADLMAMNARETHMLTRTEIRSFLEGFSMAVFYIASGRLCVEIGKANKD